jgi:hypothetical protein
MRELSIAPTEVERQIALFKNPPPFAHLTRPAAVADGIHVISDSQKSRLLSRYEKARADGRLSKFVPASGAATRMFQSLLKLLEQGNTDRETLRKKSEAGDPESLSALLLMDSFPRVAFYEDLRACLQSKGLDLPALLTQGDYGPVWDCLLSEAGLGYGVLSKGLIQFHAHPAGPRTAFEEHFLEALRTVKDARGLSRLHFTVAPEHRQAYEKKTRQIIEKLSGAGQFQVDFSEQAKSYQTIAVDLKNDPFRDSKGRLLFRPAGHGALIQNLDGLGADIVFIKNIDNVVIEKLLEPTLEWKKLLAGYLLETQSRIFALLDQVESGSFSEGAAEEAAGFMERDLWVKIPVSWRSMGLAEKKGWILNFLNRPIRVCGVVPNTGEPGGGPFWVAYGKGVESLQIVEGAQVDPKSESQRAIFRQSTHFNPVDLVCAISDRQGRPYNLKSYVDEAAVFISQKSHQGRDLKALELPGLWNGAMAQWLTLFVEVPLATFNPVKTVFDLLKPAHQSPFKERV